MRPQPAQTVCDPACGTGGFLLAAHDYITNPANFALDRDQKQFLRDGALHGWEIVDATARLCVMNLHPFVKKSSIIIINEEGKADKESISYERTDFFATTSNKQLNFLQHVYTLLKTNGKAAVVVPDNVLFEGGAGETIRKRLLKQCDVHTLLRLPTGIFYAQGVKANVLFFDKRPGREEPWTDKLWIYDLRTNVHFTLKTNPLAEKDLQDFIACFNPDNRHERRETERSKRFSYDELLQRDKASIGIFWLKDESLEDSANLPAPEILAQEIAGNLEVALDQFSSIYETLNIR